MLVQDVLCYSAIIFGLMSLALLGGCLNMPKPLSRIVFGAVT